MLTSACAERPETATRPSEAPGSQRDLYEANATVLESGAHGPELCLGVILDSLPPQCGGVPLVGWDWDAVDGEERAGRTIWGEYHVTGVYDDGRFTVSEVAAPKPPEEHGGDPVDTACEEPPGGWTAVDPERASEDDAGRAAQAARKETDFSGAWVDYEEGSGVILNVAFTGSLDRHERELRAVWGGPLCLVEHDKTYAELRRIQSALSSEPGLDVLWSSTDEVNGTVEIGVTVLDAETRAELEEEYGAGVVEVVAQLRPAG